MGTEIIIVPIMFGIIFGIFYLHYSTRNKERLALIEKGADASIFNLGKRAGSSWKVIVINLAFLMIGIGVGVFLAAILDEYSSLESDAVYPALIFTMAGIGLYAGFTQTKKAVDND
jgi:hypothetical protein